MRVFTVLVKLLTDFLVRTHAFNM